MEEDVVVSKEPEYRSTETKSPDIEAALKAIVSQHCAGVDAIIHKIRCLLSDDTDQLTDAEIDDILLQLPILLYDAMEEQETVGIQQDLAGQILKEAQSEAFRLARGTISDKTAVADLHTRSQQLEKILYDRSYKIIKQKFEMAVETLNAVKKIQSSRVQRYDLSKFNKYGI